VERFPASPTSPTIRRLSITDSVRVGIAVAVAYYFGAQIGLALTFVPATTSVLWPPNAILTSALLLVPVRAWWICLAAAFPVHVLLETSAGFSLPLVVLLFLTNCSEAVIAAGGMRVATQMPTRFDTLHGMALFIGIAGFLAPLLSSFADATVVSTFQGEPYWNVWRTRVLSNTLTELSVVPAVILGLGVLARRRRPDLGRLVEGCGLVVGLLVVAAVVYGNMPFMTMPGVPRTPTVLLLPLFFWAAVRFGVGGVSTALLVSALVASVSAMTGHRPFDVLPPLESLMAVQMYLTVMGVPLMCMAALLDERRRAALDLSERLGFEALLALISASFVRPLHGSLSSAYDESLARIGEFFQADSVALLDVGSSVRLDDRVRQWRRRAELPELATRVGSSLPWVQRHVVSGETVVFESLDVLPAEATVDRHSFAAAGLQSAVVVPSAVRGTMHGALAVATSRGRQWGDSHVERIRLLAEVVANACAREEAEFEVQRVRHELAQVARLVSMGELTSSLAHELNQPLTGILSNAQAATHYLAEDDPSLVELRAIVSDIIDDDRRARDVLQRMREMLTRRDVAPEVLDLNDVVRDVAMLITSETIIRNVSVTVRFAGEPVLVVGARVELQQAVLNVLTNAMEAVADREVTDRLVAVRVELSATGAADTPRDVRLTVQDSGAGLKPGSETHLFEPSFAMSAHGIGMGLAVARSIIENHGGTITAGNAASGGAVITICLPQAQGGARS
jgi:signal transduction histidine kinase/integral membrane sensor domain MASE1